MTSIIIIRWYMLSKAKICQEYYLEPDKNRKKEELQKQADDLKIGT